MDLPVNTIICGDAETELKKLPSESINFCGSSPPYWALRDYGIAGQLGLEPTFEEYIDKLCTIYDEVKRVLRPDGTCWVNLGDTYHNATKWTYTDGAQTISGGNPRDLQTGRKDNQGLPEKCLCLIPQRFAIEMVNRGWILRNVIIWAKPNPMPSSAKDRFTVDFEYVYFFVKNKKYWFEPQYEPSDDKQERIYEQGGNWTIKNDGDNKTGRLTNWKDKEYGCPILGRNKRTVWTIPTQAFPEAHFATFPEKLVEPMIKAGCPEFVCKKCGKAREKIYETTYISEGEIGLNDKARQVGQGNNFATRQQGRASAEHYFKGYTDCGCKDAGWRSGVCLDMFRRFGHGRRGCGKIKARLYPNRFAA